MTKNSVKMGTKVIKATTRIDEKKSKVNCKTVLDNFDFFYKKPRCQGAQYYFIKLKMDLSNKILR